MQSTAEGYEIVDRLDEHEHIELTDEQIEPLPFPTKVAPNDPPKSLAQDPRRLSGVGLLSLCFQIVLSICPVIFIVLAGIAFNLHQKPTSTTGSRVQQATALAPTVFPIVFAAIIGKFFRSLGLFGVERGINLGTLERLVGSQSLFSTLERQIALRGQYLLGGSMILLWALSPVGGQSALRLLQVSPRLLSEDSTIRYLPIAASSLTAISGASGASIGWPSYAPIYMASLITSKGQENSSMDLFGNVKIPSLNSFTHHATIDDGNWTRIDYGQKVPYSSLLGIPILGIPERGNLSFKINSRYHIIDCNTAVYVKNSPFNKDGTFVDDTGLEGANFATQATGYPNLKNAIASFNMSTLNSFVNCSIAPQNVESYISCSDKSCRVTDMRNLPLNVTSWWENDYPLMRMSFSFFPLATVGALNHPGLFTSSMTEIWLQDPGSSYAAATTGDYAIRSNLSQVPLPTLSRNFEQVYNAFWMSTYGYQFLTGDLSTNMSLYDDLAPTMGGYSPSPIYFNTSHTTVTTLIGEQYLCNMIFAAILVAVSCILLLAGIATIVLAYMTLAPDILGYMSSYTRDNPFAMVEKASNLGGLERTRALREVRVIIGDVNLGQETGHIAFAVTSETRPLEKAREYD